MKEKNAQLQELILEQQNNHEQIERLKLELQAKIKYLTEFEMKSSE